MVRDRLLREYALIATVATLVWFVAPRVAVPFASAIYLQAWRLVRGWV